MPTSSFYRWVHRSPSKASASNKSLKEIRPKSSDSQRNSPPTTKADYPGVFSKQPHGNLVVVGN